MLRDLMEEVDNIQEQMGNASREMQILRKNQREALEMKTIVIEMKDGLISRMDMAEERTSECEGITIDTSNNEKQREEKGLNHPPPQTEREYSKAVE